MIDTKKAASGELAAGGQRHSSAIVYSDYTTTDPPTQPLAADPVAELLDQAQRQAERCAALAEVCELTGDDDGRWAWLRHRQKHLAILWALAKLETSP